MKIWNFGIVGAGAVADVHAKAITNLSNANLIGLCDSGSGKSKKIAEKHNCRTFNNYEDMLDCDKIDIVSIATPSGFHMEPTVAAAKTGKHVICEKPMEISLERIDTMIEAHKKAGTILGTIFQFRFDDCIEPLRQAINSNRFGVITYAGIYVPWWRNDEYYKNNWRGTRKLDGGGALMNQSIHMIDIMCHLLPDIESLQAFTASSGHPQIETEDTAVAVIRFTQGALGIIYGTTASFPGQFRRLEITGTKGTVINLENSFTLWQFDEEKSQDQQIRNRFAKIQGRATVADPVDGYCHGHTRNFKAFIDALEKGCDFEISSAQARRAVEVVLAIYKSAKEQKMVKFA